MSAFGNGSNSNGNFWYGNSTGFPGFLYKKNVGVGGRRSTKFAAGGNITCNSSTYLYNKYKPGSNGVGASSISNRRAKNRLASVCGSSNKCFPCFNTLGQYNSYTGNPNGFIPCPYIEKPPSYSATGIFDVSSNSQYNTIIIFTGNGSITFTSISSVQYLLVGGGGGGGFSNDVTPPGGGGGGGGDVLYNTFIPGNGMYTITIGSGGSGSININSSGSSGNSSNITGFTNITAIGGQGGYSLNSFPGQGGNSGAGGAGGLYINPTGTSGTNGGGGAGAWVGPNYPLPPGAGNGGANNISTLNSFNCGGGGGGAMFSGQPELKGIGVGGGGNGGVDNTVGPTNGLTNSGGGGGGGAGTLFVGGNGGSGVCIFYFNV
jgi:hypothetical protein